MDVQAVVHAVVDEAVLATFAAVEDQCADGTPVSAARFLLARRGGSPMLGHVVRALSLTATHLFGFPHPSLSPWDRAPLISPSWEIDAEWPATSWLVA